MLLWDLQSSTLWISITKLCQWVYDLTFLQVKSYHSLLLAKKEQKVSKILEVSLKRPSHILGKDALDSKNPTALQIGIIINGRRTKRDESKEGDISQEQMRSDNEYQNFKYHWGLQWG